MKMKIWIILIIAISFISSVAHAGVESSFSFTTPTGTVAPTDTIEVWGTLSLSPTSDALIYDDSLSAPYGLDSSIFPTTGSNSSLSLFNVPFASYTNSHLFTRRSCTGTFANGCSDGEYSITSGSGAGRWFDIENPFTMNAGDSRNFLLFEFTPTNGTATPGDYIFYNMSVGITIEGLDTDGNFLEANVLLPSTCPTQDASCAFTRTVSAVPLPAAVWFFAPGFLSLLGFRRRIIS